MTHISDPDPSGLLLTLVTPSRVCVCVDATSQPVMLSKQNRTGPS